MPKGVSKNGKNTKNSTTKGKCQKPKTWNGVARQRPHPPRPAFVCWALQADLPEIPGEKPVEKGMRWEREFAKADYAYWQKKEDEECERYNREMAAYNREMAAYNRS
ncbi:hypothetical protein M3Y94_00535800 [Aphelenchoides besseyi]|nr:hypothetical protein M3Y94_00535800 [Aphelenchoides besseyi]